MKLVYEPKVYLVGRQEIDFDEKMRFLNDEGAGAWTTDAQCDAEELCEIAGRLCYQSYAKPRPGGNKAYLGHIIESQHGSVLEHAAWNFIFTGISRTLTHELVRHRAGVAYSQLSQRYVDESEANFVVPVDMIEQVRAAQAELLRWSALTPGEEAKEVLELAHGADAEPLPSDVRTGLDWMAGVEEDATRYRRLVDHLYEKGARQKYQESCDLVEGSINLPDGPVSFEVWRANLPYDKRTEIRKAARQAARSVLPNATETKIFVSANARSWRHMIEMRCSRFAEPEIRRLFNLVYAKLNAEAPALFGDYEVNRLPDGTSEITTKNRKV